MLRLILFLLLISSFLDAQKPLSIKEYSSVIIGAQQFDAYVPSLKNKSVGIVTNITGVIGSTSIVDTLLLQKVKIKKIFGPEHGFRSLADAGEKVKSHKDAKTGLPVISLYGSNKKPTKEQLKHLNVLIYDIQDIGVRFYTYISTMCYAMEACAENNIEFVVLDRPNPNGFYIDGPVLDSAYKSFLGLHPVPIVYGMTCGEYAQMANEEGWLKNKVKCKLKVVTMKDYDRTASYKLPVKPSPNIPNTEAVLLYPSLGLFEGTIASLGRGTPFPFQVVGHPLFSAKEFSFIPLPSDLSKAPRYVNQVCYGLDLRKSAYLTNHPRRIELSWLLTLSRNLATNGFFEDNFNYHVGNKLLKQQIQQEFPEEEIRSSWIEGIERFKAIRKKYLMYPDFN
ncbi:MAG: DUF1343 domain-containing protein [bacterium]|nr:DUF1343 domain-containing protein [bacterium]